MGKVKDLPCMESTTGPIDVNVVSSVQMAENAAPYEVDLPVAATDVPFVLPAGSKRFTVFAGTGRVKINYVSTATGKNVELIRGASYSENDIDPTATNTLHFQSNIAGDKILVIIWT